LPTRAPRYRITRRSEIVGWPVSSDGIVRDHDLAARRVEVEGKAVSLTRREWAVLECLSLNIGRVVAKDRLLQAIANWDEDIGANAIEVYVSRLRTKLGGSAPIRTVRGLGYRLDDTPG
jgi:DNA-binding response OmpR family regulator